MPTANNLNRDNKATVNPFDDEPEKVPTYTAIEIATLQSRLDRQLGPEYISTRPGAGGGKVHYLAAEKVINLANEVFGFNGWSSAIQQVQVDFVDESPNTGKVTLGLSIIVRVTLKDGTYHEDIGYGHIENCKGKAAAFEKAKKEAATDALKRALRNFGNVLGNCLYDKDYLQKVTKIKVAPSRWDAENLHRHPDFAPIKRESIDDAHVQTRGMPRMRSDRSALTNGSTEYGEDEFGGNLFDDGDLSHPDEVMLEASAIEDQPYGHDSAVQHAKTPKRPMERVQSMPNVSRGSMQPPAQANAAVNGTRPVAQTSGANRHAAPPPRPPQQVPRPAPQAIPNGIVSKPPGPPTVDGPGDDWAPAMPAGKFVSMSALHKGAVEDFNPNKETPSIRRTTGVNAGKSEPITRAVLKGEVEVKPNGTGPPANAQAGGMPPRTNFVNPAADAHRRVGMPVTAQSPLANRNAYKPPSAVKRPAPVDAPPARPPLADMTNAAPVENGGGEAKKPKIEPVAPPRPAEAAQT